MGCGDTTTPPQDKVGQETAMHWGCAVALGLVLGTTFVLFCMWLGTFLYRHS